MKFIENIKKIFKKPKKSKDIIPNISKIRDEDQKETEKRLTEYLAEEQKRKQKFEEKRYEEIQAEKRDKGESSEERSYRDSRKKQAEQKRIEEQAAEQWRIEELKIIEQRAGKKRLQGQEEAQRRIEELKVEKQRAEQRRLEKERVEEQRKIEEIKAKERKILEKERLNHIHGLYQNEFREYLIEAEHFRHEFGKNIKCDVCGKWESDLSNHRGQTYCEKCIPAEVHRENERKVIAGKHGASQDFIKK